MADEKNIGTPAEEEIEIITLTDENGEDMDFEFLDLVEYEGKRYAVLLPPVEDVEGEDENEDEEVLILQVEDDGNEEKTRAMFSLMTMTFSPLFLTFSKRNLKTNSTSQKSKFTKSF